MLVRAPKITDHIFNLYSYLSLPLELTFHLFYTAISHNTQKKSQHQYTG